MDVGSGAAVAVICGKQGQGVCKCVCWGICVLKRVTHALSIKRIESDQVARQLGTIVPPDNSSGLLSLSLCLFWFLTFGFVDTRTL